MIKVTISNDYLITFGQQKMLIVNEYSAYYMEIENNNDTSQFAKIFFLPKNFVQKMSAYFICCIYSECISDYI